MPLPSVSTATLLAEFTTEEWMWSGGLIEISLVLAALLGAVWLVGRRG
ncbi:hypothetical protein KQ304_09375 [Synechococcus sp. CS-1329]|nr:hypothetical protein [Synechococcus sp. CS-1329]MCT0219208.1 hypothetical protein [Synechococcus sp. CS-1329]